MNQQEDDVELDTMRSIMQQDINSKEADRAALEKVHGKVWDTVELSRDFQVHSFLAPFVSVTRKVDSKKGVMVFQHSPRFYFDWQEE